jgi:tetratricopeptide (TPR) repeat protein
MNRADGTQSLNDYGSFTSLQSSIFQSTGSDFFSRIASKEALNVQNAINLEQSVGSALTNGSLNPLFVALGFLDSEKSFFDLIHDLSHREMLYNPFEIYKYRTINHIGTPHDAYTEMPIEDEEILEFEKDPGKELDHLNFLIKSSPAPVPSNFRRRGYAYMRCGKYDEAIGDFDKSLTHGTFLKFHDRSI